MAEGTACFTFIWAIKNYCEPPCFYVHSPWFSDKLLEETRWSLLLMDEVDLDTKVACRIERGFDGKEENININFDLAIIGEDGLPLVSKSGELCFEEFSRSEWLPLVDKIAILKSKETFLPKDTLTLRCQLRKKNSSISGTDICFARTILGMEKREVFWTNKDFSHLQSGQNRSLLIQPRQKDAPTIELTLYLKQTDEEEDLIIEVNLGDERELHGVIAKISVIDAKGQLAHTKSKGNLQVIARDNCLKFTPFIKKAMLLMDESLYLLNNTLYLKCELKTSFGVVFNKVENYGYGLTTTVKSPLCEESTSDLKSSKETFNSNVSCNSDSMRHSENMNCDSTFCCFFCPLRRALERLEKDGILPDVCLTNGPESFHVHKDILRNKSHEFKKIFAENVITKRFDLKTQHLHYLLTYIYTGILGHIDRETAMDMLEASKKYNLEELNKACSEFLESSSSSSKTRDGLILQYKQQGRKPKRRIRHLISDIITSSFF